MCSSPYCQHRRRSFGRENANGRQNRFHNSLTLCSFTGCRRTGNHDLHRRTARTDSHLNSTIGTENKLSIRQTVILAVLSDACAQRQASLKGMWFAPLRKDPPRQPDSVMVLSEQVKGYCGVVGVEQSDAVPRAALVHVQSRHAIPVAPQIVATRVFPSLCCSSAFSSRHITLNSCERHERSEQFDRKDECATSLLVDTLSTHACIDRCDWRRCLGHSTRKTPRRFVS